MMTKKSIIDTCSKLTYETGIVKKLTVCHKHGIAVETLESLMRLKPFIIFKYISLITVIHWP